MFAVVSLPAAAHPHVWIDVSVDFKLDSGGRLASVRQSWTFDEMFSSYAVFGLDTNGDGVYSAEELAPLKDEMISSYRPQGFFSKAVFGGADVVLTEPEAAELRVAPQGALILSFTQRPPSPETMAGETFRLQVRDPAVFIDFRFPPEMFGAVEPPTPQCTVARDDGQPPKTANPDALMRALIDGTAQIPTRAVTLSCRS